MPSKVELCLSDGCRRKRGHQGSHNLYPTEAWTSFFEDKDCRKIVKAGFATPRGGAKGAYQNHVDRSNKVIIPYEFLENVELANYQDGYVIRLFPDQYFSAPSTPKEEFTARDSIVQVGTNAFVLYRTHSSLEVLPPLADWDIRYLMKDGEEVARRGAGVEDHGHYVLRLPTLGAKAARDEGPPQGLFATEYADVETNFLCKCVLALLIVVTEGSPYTSQQSRHLRAILEAEGLLDRDEWEHRGIIKGVSTLCPLCLGRLHYPEYHQTLALDSEGGLENAGAQVEGATRSTKINLFHLRPLFYKALVHVPKNIGWGHAVCNTRLGQRPCYSVAELEREGQQITLVGDDGSPHGGRMSMDGVMIRSDHGGVWIEIVREGEAGEEATTEAVVDEASISE